MATDITLYTNKIKTAVYGKDVRSSIISALTLVNADNNKYDAIKMAVESARDTAVKNCADAIAAVDSAKTTVTNAKTENTKLTKVVSEAKAQKTALDALLANPPYDAKAIGQIMYPVGSIYISVNAANPSTIFGGTWEQVKDTFLLACGTKYAAASTGGSADAVVPSHTHTITASSESAGDHEHDTSGTAASAGAHTHTTSGTAASAGAHTHTVSGTAASNGAHTHGMGNVWNSGTGSSNAYMQTSNRTLTTRNTASAGAHAHTVSGTAASAGAHTHTTSGTAASAGAHTHSVTGKAASAGAHTHTVKATAAKTGVAVAGKNMPPYLAVYVWKRTA